MLLGPMHACGSRLGLTFIVARWWRTGCVPHSSRWLFVWTESAATEAAQRLYASAPTSRRRPKIKLLCVPGIETTGQAQTTLLALPTGALLYAASCEPPVKLCVARRLYRRPQR